MKLSLNSYTKRDTNIIKGFAILCIVLHNYFHWLVPSPGENEFDFSPARVHSLFDLLGQQPGEFVNILFSYFGHYGVQLFVMISGFGLTLSMLRREQGWGEFVINRLKKLYPLLITGVVVCLLGCLVMNGRLFNQGEWREIGYKFLFIHTLIPNSGLSINGPWWFFGLIFQLYLLYPLLFRCMKKWKWQTFLVVCAISYGLIFLFREYLNLHHGTILMQNAPGHLPEFCLGMVLAFSKDKKIHWLWLVLAIALFVWGNFTPGFYPFTFLSLCVITVFATQAWKAKTGRWKKVFRFPFSVLHYFGGISMTLFIVHGYFRTPVLKWANTLTGAWGHLASGLLFFLLVWGIALAAKPLYQWLQGLFEKIRVKKEIKAVSILFQVAFLLFFLYVGAYYVRQNLARHTAMPLNNQLQVESGSIHSSDPYVSLAGFPLEKNHLIVHLEGSFDIKKGVDFQPCLVADIQKELWKIVDLRQTQNGEWTHCEFKYDYLRPFTSKIAGKDLKLYFWNKDQREAEFKDFTIFGKH